MRGLLFVFFFTSINIFTLYSSNVDKEEFHVYLCFGQSNMEGHAKVEEQDTININSRFVVLQTVNCPTSNKIKGKWRKAVPPLTRCNTGLSPADYFGRTMIDSLPPNIKIGIINVSVGGCKIELFDKENFESYVLESPQWLQNMVKEYDGDPYKRLVEMAKLAQSDGAIIKGILLHQGESNSGDQDWPLKVEKVYNNLLLDLGLPSKSLPLLVGEMLNFDQSGACASMNEIIQKLPEVMPNAYVIPSKGCEGIGDNLHFNASGYRELGKRYAKQMLEILKVSNE